MSDAATASRLSRRAGVAARVAAPARGASSPGSGRMRLVETDPARARRLAAGDRDGQRRRPPDARQPAPDRRPAHLARLHRPRLPQPLDRPAAARTNTSQREVVCGNTSPGAPEGTRTQLCLAIWGPVHRRAAHGARRLVPARRTPRTTCAPIATAASGRAVERGSSCPPVSAGAPAATARPRAVAGRADAARLARRGGRWSRSRSLRGGAALLDARPAELLVRRGVHARARAAARASGRRCTRSSTPRTRRRCGTCSSGRSSRVFGTGVVALRLLSALAGIATVPVAWAIGRELAGRRAALVARRARRRQPAVRVVLAGGARLRAVRAARRRSRCCASCAPSASPRRAAWRRSR